ncbi:MFS transporter [Paraburkholderia sp. 22B1P]|uniref:MFS transporter n=1 Tax=Paraburkholderia sp. 22B1P TaxID=3080498 RepID=UPI00308E42FA|nr:MFS transporter [Paraburkholderia sp. 22B1P]
MLNSHQARAATRTHFWRIGMRTVPLLFLCYVVAMVDRLNVGFAKLQFLADLHLNEAVFGLAAGFLYLGYILFEVPSNLMLHRYGARKTLLRIMVLWGIFTIVQAFASNKYQFYALRFLVGAAEAGFFPGVLLYFTYWFPDHMRGRVTSLFVMALPVSGIIGGPIAAWIMTDFNNVGGLRGWQSLFILEGIPAIILGVVAYLNLADRPSTARWLSSAEKQVIAEQLNDDDRNVRQDQSTKLIDAFKNNVLYKLSICYFAFYCVENALLLWIPTLLKSVGVKSLMSIGWLSGAIALAATVCMLTVSFSSDRRRERRWHVLGCGMVAGICFLLLPLGATNIAVTVALLVASSAAVFGFLALFWTIPSALFKDTAAAGSLALVSSIGALGGTFSPIFIGWIKEATGSFYYALGTLGCVFLVSLLLLDSCFPRRQEVGSDSLLSDSV